MTDTHEDTSHDGHLCNSITRSRAGRCQLPAGWGTPHRGHGACKLHGGAMENHVTKGKLIMAKEAVNNYSLPQNVEPTAALFAELARSAGACAYLSERVAELSTNQIVWGVAEQTDTSGGDEGAGWSKTTSRAGVNTWVSLYGAERKHLVDVAKTIKVLGLEERRVAAETAQIEALAAAIITVVSDTLARLGVNYDELPVREAAQAAMFAVTSPRAAIEGQVAQ